MCARYEVDASVDKILQQLMFIKKGVLAVPESGLWPKQIRPYGKAPVVTAEGVRLMQFSLLPSWSKEKRVKFSTYNARLSDEDDKTNKKVWIFDKPTWRRPFSERHCLVPMTDFIEPIYQGPYAGHWVRFAESSKRILFAAGIWEEWRSQTNGEVIESFAILTDEPLRVVEDMGHGRSPLFLDEAGCEAWLNLGASSKAAKKKPMDWVDLLIAHRRKPTISASQDEAMKPGWEKRA